MKWRLLVDKAGDAFTNMAVDKAILFGRDKPTLRFYQWKPPAVSIGFFQSLGEEVDREKCRAAGVDIVRRLTGGGAVFHEKELTYSLAIGESNPKIPPGIKESYQKICSALIAGLGKIGLQAEYAPLNDILVNGKKVSGCAQTRKKEGLLQHGTMILQVDIEKMFSLLRVPNEKMRGKMIEKAGERVTSLERELGGKTGFSEMVPHFQAGFEETFGIKLVPGRLSSREKSLAKQFREEFSSWKWNCRR